MRVYVYIMFVTRGFPLGREFTSFFRRDHNIINSQLVSWLGISSYQYYSHTHSAVRLVNWIWLYMVRFIYNTYSLEHWLYCVYKKINFHSSNALSGLHKAKIISLRHWIEIYGGGNLQNLGNSFQENFKIWREILFWNLQGNCDILY